MSVAISNHLIAYIDFLGTSNKIIKDTNHQHFKFLKNLYADLYKTVEQTNKESLPYLKKIKIRTFSDNILLSISTNLTKRQLEYTLGDFIYLCAKIQAEALKKGILSRGGITIGELSNDNHFVYGKGLLEAVTLEEKIACYPRILIQESIVQEFIKNNEWNFNTLVDDDNRSFVDYLKPSIKNKEDLSLYESYVENIKKENLEANEKILAKINWLVDKFQIFKQEFNEGN